MFDMISVCKLLDLRFKYIINKSGENFTPLTCIYLLHLYLLKNPKFKNHRLKKLWYNNNRTVLETQFKLFNVTHEHKYYFYSDNS